MRVCVLVSSCCADIRVGELARWRSVGCAGLLAPMLANKWFFIIASQSIVYHKSISPFQSYLVTVEYAAEDVKWFDVKHEFRSPDSNVLYATIEGKGVIKSHTGKTIPPVEFLRAAQENSSK